MALVLLGAMAALWAAMRGCEGPATVDLAGDAFQSADWGRVFNSYNNSHDNNPG